MPLFGAAFFVSSDIKPLRYLRYTAMRCDNIFDAICAAAREGIYIISQLRSSYIAFAVRQIYRVLHRKTYRSSEYSAERFFLKSETRYGII